MTTYDNARFEFEAHLREAEKGDAEAQYQAARCYRIGHGVNKCKIMAKVWLWRAVAQGHSGAEADLAELLLSGPRRAPRPEDREKAVRLLLLAAQQRNKKAYEGLRGCLRKKMVSQENLEALRRLCERDAGWGIGQAQACLGDMLANAERYGEAERWYKEAGRSGVHVMCERRRLWSRTGRPARVAAPPPLSPFAAGSSRPAAAPPSAGNEDGPEDDVGAEGGGGPSSGHQQVPPRERPADPAGADRDRTLGKADRAGLNGSTPPDSERAQQQPLREREAASAQRGRANVPGATPAAAGAQDEADAEVAQPRRRERTSRDQMVRSLRATRRALELENDGDAGTARVRRRDLGAMEEKLGGGFDGSGGAGPNDDSGPLVARLPPEQWHFPRHVKRVGRCALCHAGRPVFVCEACGVYLCVQKRRNDPHAGLDSCFKIYHVCEDPATHPRSFGVFADQGRYTAENAATVAKKEAGKRRPAAAGAGKHRHAKRRRGRGGQRRGA